MEQSSWESAVIQLERKFCALYGTRKFFTVSTRDRNLSLYWASRIQQTPSNQIFYGTFYDCPPSFPTKILYAFLICPIRTICPAHLLLFDFINLILFYEKYELSSSLCSLLLSLRSRIAQWYSVGLRTGWSGVRVPAVAGNFFHHRVQNGSGAHPASYLMGTRDSFPGGRAAGAWSWLLTFS
jgi:hypothetical protein